MHVNTDPAELKHYLVSIAKNVQEHLGDPSVISRNHADILTLTDTIYKPYSFILCDILHNL